MPTVTKVTAFNATGGSNAFVQLNADIQGQVRVTLRPAVDMVLITDPSVTSSATAISAEATKGMFIAAGGAGYTGFTLDLDPCKTWIRAFGAAGGNCWAAYQW